MEYPPAPVPDEPTRASLLEAVHDCRACDLWEGATHAVMGEGAGHAEVMFVGEQPGDREDIEGHPFVGPAGGVLDTGLERAGIPRHDVYITNVVKHFRYKARGKRRIHQKPDRWQIQACLPWLHAELGVVQPVALVCLGATAAQALLGSQVRIGRDRGRPLHSDLAELVTIRIGRDRGRPLHSDLAELVTITTHPSAILRAEEADRRQAMDEFVSDLSNVAHWLGDRPAA